MLNKACEYHKNGFPEDSNEFFSFSTELTLAWLQAQEIIIAAKKGTAVLKGVKAVAKKNIQVYARDIEIEAAKKTFFESTYTAKGSVGCGGGSINSS